MESMLWTRLTDGRLRCGLCAHACVLSPGQRGRCGVRSNHEGQPLSLVDGLVTGVQADPVEKKPLYHFLPGSRTFSVGSAGCNFSCRFCQNHHISRDPLEQERIRGHEATPEMLVEAALRTACRSLAFTYNEPTVFVELLAATAALGQERGLPSILVSNGFMSPGCLELLVSLWRASFRNLPGAAKRYRLQSPVISGKGLPRGPSRQMPPGTALPGRPLFRRPGLSGEAGRWKRCLLTAPAPGCKVIIFHILSADRMSLCEEAPHEAETFRLH